MNYNDTYSYIPNNPNSLISSFNGLTAAASTFTLHHIFKWKTNGRCKFSWNVQKFILWQIWHRVSSSPVLFSVGVAKKLYKLCYATPCCPVYLELMRVFVYWLVCSSFLVIILQIPIDWPGCLMQSCRNRVYVSGKVLGWCRHNRHHYGCWWVQNFLFVTITGVEPMAFGFGIQCSTNWAKQSLKKLFPSQVFDVYVAHNWNDIHFKYHQYSKDTHTHRNIIDLSIRGII